MEFEQYFVNEWKSDKSTTTTTTSSFDCSICLEFARDPVVTLCGHLYCWPCIYKWLISSSDDEEKCPICKAHISQQTIVPLYGRGQSVSESESEQKGIIPPRPTANSMIKALISDRRSHDRVPLYHRRGAAVSSSSSDHPVVGMYGEMVYARIFGDSYYALGNGNGNGSPRLRRRELQVDQSLNRVSIFLFCCLLLCLFLF